MELFSNLILKLLRRVPLSLQLKKRNRSFSAAVIQRDIFFLKFDSISQYFISYGLLFPLFSYLINYSKAVAQRCTVIKMFLEILQNSQENNCVIVSFLIMFCNFIEITLRYGCSPENLQHIFRTSFPKNTSGWLLLRILIFILLYTMKWNCCNLLGATLKNWKFPLKTTLLKQTFFSDKTNLLKWDAVLIKNLYTL